MTPKLIAVAAITADYVIAVNNQLPVHSPKDLAFFKQLTTGHHVVMGRKTFDTLGKPLPNRNNIVITYTPLKTDHSVHFSNSYINAFRSISIKDPRNVFIIGGSQIYRDLVPMCDELYLTVFNTQADPYQNLTYFPYNHDDLNAFFSTHTVVSEFQEGNVEAVIIHYTK